MSLKENELYLEQSREVILKAVDEKDWGKAREIACQMKEHGFEDEFSGIWDELSESEREEFLSWWDELIKK